ncbi:hypothetical protein YH63_012195 [Afipia massiliensis]|uniref:Uncharacterized protein n=1 Tax=Afipia massiliensis TaxID=211460 RepID=A0A4U6BP20_9BRAD|nr:hypothetical protein YH63_012195 [Afipia massiliensis]
MLPVIARSVATKQSSPYARKLDCFASLAMTIEATGLEINIAPRSWRAAPPAPARRRSTASGFSTARPSPAPR